MQFEILYRPAQAMARVTLAPGEQLSAETGAMVGMSGTLDVQTAAKGGMMGGLKRLLGGESFFLNRFTAARGPGEVLLAPPICGDMLVLPVEGQGLYLQSSAFVAGETGVTIESKLGGFRGFFSGAGVFVLKAVGSGQVVLGGFGAIEQVDVDGDFIVDTGHLVAWDVGLPYTVEKAGGGWISSFLSGEGLVCTFRGRGRVWLQTRNPVEYGTEVGALLPPREG
jgi:uncharacterized protein (TIGR00266 family)